jgi:crotonobetainyl-CoA:carnitine CoA-transferase CaiB-like acyl-CoA transferase
LTENTGPLTGLKVLDLTWAAAGPVVTTYLTFLGAEVVKVEHSSRPDLMRVSDRQYGYGNDRGINDSPLFNELAAGKRSVELDLNKPDDLEVATRLALVADVLVENMRPGKIEKLGLSYELLSKSNPGLVMCSVSGTGRSSVEGPPGYAPIFWAEGGGAWMTGWPDRNPGLVRGPIDLHAAAFACLGVLSLLRRRELTGEGGYLDCSAIEAVASSLGVHLLEAQLDLPQPLRSGNTESTMLINDVFPCTGDDRWIALSLRDERDAQVFADSLRRQFGVDLSVSKMTGEGGWEHIASATRTLDASAVESNLLATGIACSRSMSMLQAMTDTHLLARKALQTIVHDTIGEQLIVGLPWRMNGRPYEVHRPAPKLGGDNEQVLKEWLGKVHA